MEFLLSPGVIFGIIITVICAIFFYIFGQTDRPPGWKWAAISFGIWVFIALVLRLGILPQLMGQFAFFAYLTWRNMSEHHESHITK
jgi:hypothetical protein